MKRKENMTLMISVILAMLGLAISISLMMIDRIGVRIDLVIGSVICGLYILTFGIVNRNYIKEM